MKFSPVVLLRQPVYTLDHLETFSFDLSKSKPNEDDIERLRQHFLTFIQSKHLLRSLPFSSKTLYQALPHYEFHAAVKIRKKEKQNERALIRYLMRMALNPSPLADFARTQFYNWDGAPFSSKAKFSIELALNQRKEFLDLCYCDVGLQSVMRHRLNPSLRKEESTYSYIYQEEEEKSLVKLEYDEEFDKMFLALQKVDFTFSEFVNAYDYDVNELLDAQLITPSYPVYTDKDILQEIINSVNEKFALDFNIEEFEGKTRNDLSDKDALSMQAAWTKKLNAYADHLEVKLNDKIYPERVFYLNSANENDCLPEFEKSIISTELVSLLSTANNLKKEANTNVSNTDLFLSKDLQVDDFDLQRVNVVQKSEFIFELALEEPGTTNSLPNEIGVMLQHIGEAKPLLVNSTTAYGKFFAPSISLASEEVVELIREWVSQNDQDVIAIKDESTHSKNKSHSFLKELDNFGVDFHSPIKNRVKVSLQNEKMIDIDQNKEVHIANLGIEDYRSRSAYIQNLIQIGNALPDLQKFIKGVQDKLKIEKPNRIVVTPRIETVSLIIGLQTWTVNESSAFPDFTPTVLDNMLILDEWRKEVGLPRVVKAGIDCKRTNYLDFYNFWSVDTFIRNLKTMESVCKFTELGLPDKFKGIQVKETYFEFRR